MNQLKILCPAWKPLKEWTSEDKHAALTGAALVALFFIGGLIEAL